MVTLFETCSQSNEIYNFSGDGYRSIVSKIKIEVILMTCLWLLDFHLFYKEFVSKSIDCSVFLVENVSNFSLVFKMIRWRQTFWTYCALIWSTINKRTPTGWTKYFIMLFRKTISNTCYCIQTCSLVHWILFAEWLIVSTNTLVFVLILFLIRFGLKNNKFFEKIIVILILKWLFPRFWRVLLFYQAYSFFLSK